MTAATPIYRALMVAIETRRRSLGLAMWQLDEAAGTQDGYYAKALWADTKSGRQANWSTVQLMIDALFPDGHALILRPKKRPCLTADSQRVAVRFAGARFDAETRQDFMRDIARKGGLKGGPARAKKLSKRKLSRIGKKGARARWRKPRLVEITSGGRQP